MVCACIYIAAHLCSSTFFAASILHAEGILWLNSIYRRLAGRVSVKQPYYAEVHQNIPVDIFAEVTQLLYIYKHFMEPHCIIDKNSKGVVISFTCFGSLLAVPTAHWQEQRAGEKFFYSSPQRCYKKWTQSETCCLH